MSNSLKDQLLGLGFSAPKPESRPQKPNAAGRPAQPQQAPPHHARKDAPRDAFRTELARFFDRFDLLVTPTLAQPPIAAERWGKRPWPWVFAADARYAPFPAPWNFAGYPAITVPAGVHPRTGTPLAVQLVAPDGGEPLLLGVAALLERLAPWPRVAPGY